MRKAILLAVILLAAGLCVPGTLRSSGGAAAKGAAAKAVPAPSASQVVLSQWNEVGRKLIAMAEDFPEDKYDFKLKPEMRTFGEVLVHVASGNVYAAKAAHGEKVNWDELDPKGYKGKAAIEAAGGVFDKSVKKGTDYLVAGADVGATKLKDAQKKGVKVIDEAELEHLLRGERLDPPE